MQLTEDELKDCESLLREQLCFSHISDKNFKELAGLFYKETFRAGYNIISEGEAIESVHILAHGSAEVTKRKVLKNVEIVAELNRGEAIGLAKISFHSQTGERGATVTAINDVETYTISIKNLYDFITQHKLSAEMEQMADLFRRLSFIKKISPFSQVSGKKLFDLVKNTDEVEYSAEQVIFTQGDLSDFTYFIVEGKVEIDFEKNGKQRILAVLQEHDIFGEAGIILNARRSATARTVTHCKLLKVKGSFLLTLRRGEKLNTLALMRLMRSRSRPSHSPSVEIHERENAMGESIYLLKNTDTGGLYQIEEEGMFIWKLVDGHRTIAEISKLFEEEYHEYSGTTAATYLMGLATEGYIHLEGFETKLEKVEDRPTLTQKIFSIFRKALEINYAFKNVDTVLTKIYPLVGWIFKPITQLILIPVIVIGFIYFLVGASKDIAYLHALPTHTILESLGLVYLLFTFSVVCHELAHAFAVKHFKHRVNGFGIGWYWVGPVAFCDTTDILLAPAKQRMVVNVAGIYTDSIWCAVLAIIAFYSTHPLISLLCWLYAMWNYISILRNLNPIMDLDGYYMMIDLTNEPDLREKSINWLVTHAFKGHFDWVAHKREAFYWAVVIGFQIVIVPVIWWVQYYILGAIFPTLQNIYISLILPILAPFLSLWVIWADIKQRK